MIFKDTTIAAISTAYGESGIGIIRMSGPDSPAIAKKIFVPGKKAKKSKDFEFKPRYMHFGHIADPETGRVIDEVLCVYMKGPASYTGEDCVEIHCHGGMLSVREILSLCLRTGAEPAEPGEFTKRAFINGRLDLSQAEAVIDIIKAPSEMSLKAAVKQLTGGLSGKVEEISADLLEILVGLTVNMDYPDEDIEETTYSKLFVDTKLALEKLEKLIEGSREGKIIREGLSVVIAGKPNVGKSSLLNALLEENRSIVTDIPGTTRDTIEESAVIRGISVRLTDTAGIRDSQDRVETLGIERSRQAVDSSDLVLLVLDGSSPLTSEDEEIIKLCAYKPVIAVINKQDKGQVISEERLGESLENLEICRTSLNSGDCCSVCDAIESFVFGKGVRRVSEPLLTNERHIKLCNEAKESLTDALSSTESRMPFDFIEVDIRRAFDLLGEITGHTASDDVINTVFERFCLGK